MDIDLISQQNDLLIKAEKILSSTPKSGLYNGENSSDFENFLLSVYDVFKQEEGPRAEIQKEIKESMLKNKEILNPIFQLIDTNVTDPIAKIYQKYKKFCPGELYLQKCKIEKNIEIMTRDITSLENDGSYLKKSIINGMKAKNLDVLLIETKISDILTNKKKYLDLSKSQLENTKSQLISDLKYQKWLQLSKILQPFFSKWLNVDSQIGKDANIRGISFEERCETILPAILSLKLHTKDFLLYKNISWINCDGEIDFVITDLLSEKVLALIECKARLFDICYGYDQSGPEGRKKQGKKTIKINDKTIEVNQETPCFVVSLIQEHAYQLGFESKLKESLNKYLLDYDKEWKKEEIYDHLKNKFGDKISPLNWFYKFSKTNLIIL